MGFFAEVGPLTVFVSHQVRLSLLIPILILYSPHTAHPPRHEIRPKLEPPILCLGRTSESHLPLQLTPQSRSRITNSLTNSRIHSLLTRRSSRRTQKYDSKSSVQGWTQPKSYVLFFLLLPPPPLLLSSSSVSSLSSHFPLPIHASTVLTTVHFTPQFAIGTIKEDHLGVIE